MTATQKEIDRFMAHVDKSGGCWEWTGPKVYGYGSFSWRGGSIRAHRWSKQYLGGADLKKLFVCHRCHNRACVKPDHLFLGTAKDNYRSSAEDGRPTGRRVKVQKAQLEPDIPLDMTTFKNWRDSLRVRLWNARVSRRLTQKDLGEMVGVVGSSIGNYERGTHPLCFEMFFVICAALKIAPEEFFKKEFIEVRRK